MSEIKNGSFVISNQVKEIGSAAFSKVISNLQEITIQNSVSHIDDESFFFCTLLKDVSIPNSVKVIGSGTSA